VVSEFSMTAALVSLSGHIATISLFIVSMARNSYAQFFASGAVM
jgi:hypothetical protein